MGMHTKAIQTTKTITITKVITWSDGEAPPQPGAVSLRYERQIGMARFSCVFVLPPPSATDVKNRELTVTVNGVPGVGSPQLISGDPLPMESPPWEFNEGDAVVATLIDIDGASNRSSPSPEFKVTVTDQVAPPAPGALGFKEVTQIDEPPPVVNPLPNPPPGT